MSTDNALAIYQQFDTMQRAAVVLVESGFFKDVQSKAQAIVKVMAGAELGLPPFASMTGIAIIQGKPVLGANLIATLVKNDPRYDYRPVEHTDTSCVIEWREKGKVVGQSAFTWEEATRAGLTGKDNWRKYPSDMLFARAISRGARRFAPGIFGGSPIYTPDELGADVDEDGNVVEGEIVHPAPVSRQPEPPPVPRPVPAGLNPETGEVMTPAPLDNAKRELFRGKVASNPRSTVGSVSSAVAAVGLYRSEQHALNAAKQLHPDVEKSTQLTTVEALKLFDDLIERKQLDQAPLFADDKTSAYAE